MRVLLVLIAVCEAKRAINTDFFFVLFFENSNQSRDFSLAFFSLPLILYGSTSGFGTLFTTNDSESVLLTLEMSIFILEKASHAKNSTTSFKWMFGLESL